MSLWREFFVINQTILLFIYGQVFFVLGLAILWQSRRHSQLDLARSLGWLGAFGLIHGLHEWGDIFIPIQAEYLSRVWIEILVLVQLCLLAFSFACLFQFGVETLHPLHPHLFWMRLIPAGLDHRVYMGQPGISVGGGSADSRCRCLGALPVGVSGCSGGGFRAVAASPT